MKSRHLESGPGGRTTSARARPAWITLLPGLLFLCMLVLPSQHAEAQERGGISLSLMPDVTWTNWPSGTGIDNTTLLGGTAGLTFGQFIELQGYFRRESSATLRAIGADDFDFIDDLIDERSLDVRSFGGQVLFSLGTGNVVPFLLGGGGIYRFRLDDGQDVDRLKANAGAGLRGNLTEWIQGEIAVEGQRYRLDQLTLAQLPGDITLPVNGNESTRTNFSVRAGLGFQVGGITGPAAAEFSPLSDVGLAVEPFAGVMSFAGGTRLSDQEHVGARLGANFGPYFGLRGFYWRGVSSSFDSFDDVQSWGGEAQFNLSEGTGIIPFLVGGGGRIAFREGFEGPEGLSPSDQNALILGGGLAFNLGDRLRLTAAARDYITGNDGFTAANGLDDVADPDDLLHNWQYTGALNFLVGGGQGFRPAVAREPEMDPRMAEMDWRRTEIERRARELAEQEALREEDLAAVTDDIAEVDDMEELRERQRELERMERRALAEAEVERRREDLERRAEDLVERGDVRGADVRDIMRGIEDVEDLDDLRDREQRLDRLDRVRAGDAEALDRRREAIERRAEELFDREGVRERDIEDILERIAEVEDMADLRTQERRLERIERRVGITPDVERRRGEEMITFPAPVMGEIYVRYGEPGERRMLRDEERPEVDRERAEGIRPETRDQFRAAIEQLVEEFRAEERAERDDAPHEEMRRMIEQLVEELRAEERPERETREELRRMIEEVFGEVERDLGPLPDDIVTREDLRDLQERLIRQLPDNIATVDDLRELEERLVRSFEEALNRRLEQIEAPPRPEREPRPDVDRDPVAEDIEEVEVDDFLQLRMEGVRPYAGIGFESPTQLVLGTSVDLGPITRGSNWHLAPEIAVGVGESPTTFMAVANLEYRVPWVLAQENFRFDPLLGAGAGLLNEEDLGAVLNLFWGGTLHLGGDPDAGLSLYIAHQGVDIFSQNRLLVGARLGGSPR